MHARLFSARLVEQLEARVVQVSSSLVLCNSGVGMLWYVVHVLIGAFAASGQAVLS